MRPLHLVVTGFWFNQITEGKKTIEYRDRTDYWRKRILGPVKHNHVVFHKGYTNTIATFRIWYVEEGPTSIEIHLGPRVRNLE